MTDREQPAILGRLNDLGAHHRRQAQIAAHQMQIIARHQNDLAGPDREICSILAIDADLKLTLDDVVIGNQVGRRP